LRRPWQRKGCRRSSVDGPNTEGGYPLRTLAVERIGKRLTSASPEELAKVIEGLNEIVGT
jgi:hypothetical protein